MENKESLLTTEEAGKVLGMSEQTMRIWRIENRGPSFVKINRSIRYLREDLEAFISSNRKVGGNNEKGE